MLDSNAIFRTHLLTFAPVVALVGDRIHSPRLPENTELPAISYLTVGGGGIYMRPEATSSSIQVDCWADNPVQAREVYRAVYDALQWRWTYPVADGWILTIYEEIHGQDIGEDHLHYWRVMSQWRMTLRETGG